MTSRSALPTSPIPRRAIVIAVAAMRDMAARGGAWRQALGGCAARGGIKQQFRLLSGDRGPPGSYLG
jgi:hypothetical protein